MTIVVCPVIALILKWYPEHFFVYANNVNLQSCKLHSIPRFVKLISILYVWYTYSIRGIKIGPVFSNLVLLINRSIKTEIPVQRSYLMLIENYKINAVQCCLSQGTRLNPVKKFVNRENQLRIASLSFPTYQQYKVRKNWPDL